MRHLIHHRKLNRTSEHRVALRRNMAQSIIEHGRITTTIAKAKDIRPFIERVVSLSIKVRKYTASGETAAALRARRNIERLLGDRAIVPAEHRATYSDMSDAARAKTLHMSSGRRYRTGEPKGRLAFTAESVMHRLIETVAPRYEDRAGGYTRLIRLSDRRLGDKTPLAMVQLIGDEDVPASLTKPRKSARKLRTDARYAMAIKTSKNWATKEGSSAGKDAVADVPDNDVDTDAADG